ncbi:type IV secretion protein Rhs, partial [Actinomadura sp. LOL_011]
MRVPSVPGGLTPKVEISYSSASVDGRTSNTNGQPSWVGQGFDLWPGFIERRYKSCEDDGAPKDEWGNSPGDQCWGYDNATVTWGGKGGELIKASDGTWRTKADDGTKFEKLTSSSIDNGDDNGEYWKVTTTDGTQYFFGLNHAPGWVSGKPETNSAWTVPVFGDDASDPCNDSAGFADSWCQQAYRWNLDYVVDPSGNAILYTYAKEANHYGRNLKPEDETAYTRGGFLKTISYGLRKDALFAKAPAQVTFTTSERCLPDDTFECDPAEIGDNPDRWWDVPWDLNCNSGQECKETHGTVSPTFWSRKRLAKVTTQIIKPDGSGYRPVDSWSLDHDWGLADVERDLLLKEIEHTGHAATDGGGAVTLPKVTFNHVQLPNRLDKSGDDILPYIRYRLGAIYDEVGGQIEVNYSDTDCSLSDLPTPETNTTRCMPVIWTPPGREDPITDWFHKYVVTSVTQVDRTGLSPHMTTKYEYVGDAAWHFDDDDGLTKEKDKTWSQWRGYGHVRTFTGDPADPATQTDTFYMRGMDGDRKTKDGGEKSVTVSDGQGGTHTDHNALAGFALRTVQYTEPGGSVHTKTVNTPWRVQTASRTRSWGTVTANVVATGTTRTWTAKDGGGWLETKTDNTFENSGPGVGRIKSVNIGGDVTTGSDDKCVRTTYADNTGAWMVRFPSRVETVAVACNASVQRPAQVISDGRTHYDDRAYGAGPVKGRITKVEKIAGYDGNTPRYVTQAENSYDAYGRITQAKNALGQATTTAFTETRGLTTNKTVTTPPATPGDAATALTSSEELDPAWGAPTRTTDANGQHTDIVYDGLGRLRKVWLPTESKDTNNPNHEFQYRIVEGEIVAVTTKTMTAGGGQRVTGIELLDGWLRTRQTQSPTTTTDAGQVRRLISDTFYDNRGQVVKTYAPYVADGAPAAELFGVAAPGTVETQTRTGYDGLGRKTVESTTVGNGEQPEQELWRTTYAYGGGNRVSVTPPSGGTPTAEISNALGQVIERRQYKVPTPTGDYDATTYTYTPAGESASVTDPSGNVWTTTYDLRGRKTETTDPDKGTSTFTYDDLDRIVSTTDARGKKVYSNYDGLNRVTDTRADAPDGTLLTSYTYDTVAGGKGKLATATRHHEGAQYTSAVEDYDDLGRATRSEVTIPAAEGALAGSYSSIITYNRDGTVKTHRPSYGGGLPYENLVYTYDEFSRQTQLTSTRGTYVNAVRYRATGEPQRIEYGTPGKRAAQNFTYQYGTRRLDASLTEREGINGYARAATYTYTDSGNITSITDASHDGVDNQCFTYDALQRLTHAWTQGTTGACADEPTTAVLGGPAPYWHTFTYDKAGNRTKQVQHGIGGQPDTVSTYTYAQPGNGNRLNTATHTGPVGDRIATYGYDATGNTTTVTSTGDGPSTSTQTFDWNTEGELA